MSLQLVGNVIDIDGPRLEFSRKSATGEVLGWFHAIRGTKFCLEDLFRTSPKTSATLQFLVAGRVNLMPGAVYEVVSAQQVFRIADYPITPLSFEPPSFHSRMRYCSPKFVWEKIEQGKELNLTAVGIEG